MKKQEFKKYEERLRNLRDNFKHSNIWILGVPEEEQEMENLFKNIVKENFPNLAKEIDFQEVQEAQREPLFQYVRKENFPNLVKEINIQVQVA